MATLPVMRLPIDYKAESEKIKEFLSHFKGPIPTQRQQRKAMMAMDDSDDDGEGDLEDDLDSMGIGSSSRREKNVSIGWASCCEEWCD